MADWAFQVVTPAGVPQAALISATGRKLSFPLNGTPTFDFSTIDPVPGLAELESDILGTRNGTVMFRGRVGPSKDTLTADETSTTWSAVGYEGALARDPVWTGSTLTWAATDQALIVKDLIQDSQALAGVDYTLDLSAIAALGVTRDYTVELGKPVGSAIDDLSAMINGFDWWIDPADLKVHVVTERGTTVSWEAVLGATATGAERSFDPATYATDVLGTGDPSTTPHVASTATRPRGRWATAQAWSDVTVQSTLNAHTDGLLATLDGLPSWSITVDPDRWSPAEAWLGDTVGLYIAAGRINEASQQRLMQVDITIDDLDHEEVVMSLARAPHTLKDRLSQIDGRVGNLERR